MIKNGVNFEELDVALMMHGNGCTQVDVKSLALSKFKVIYHGVSAMRPLSLKRAEAHWTD